MFHRTFASGIHPLRGKGDQYKTLQAWYGQHDVGRVPQISHACSEMENKKKQATWHFYIPNLSGLQLFIGWVLVSVQYNFGRKQSWFWMKNREWILETICIAKKRILWGDRDGFKQLRMSNYKNLQHTRKGMRNFYFYYFGYCYVWANLQSESSTLIIQMGSKNMLNQPKGLVQAPNTLEQVLNIHL